MSLDGYLSKITNQTTGNVHAGQLQTGTHTTIIYLQHTHLTDVQLGDSLATAQGIPHIVIGRDPYTTADGLPVLQCDCLPLTTLLKVSRNNSEIAEIRCNASVQKVTADPLGQILGDAAAPTQGQIHKARAILDQLATVDKLIDTDSDLADAIKAHRAAYDGLSRIVTQLGSACAVGDTIVAPKVGAVEIISIDRRSLQGLEILLCR